MDCASAQIFTLSEKCKSLLRSTMHITSITQCIDELILNALDADSTSIAVRVDLNRYKIQVVDNGEGMTQSHLDHLGKRYQTGNCSNLEDSRVKFGFKGETIASLKDICKSMLIISRTSGSEDTYCRVWKAGEKDQKSREALHKRLSCGTTVVIDDLFFNQPLRKKLISPSLELSFIVRCVQTIALVHPQASFSVRDDFTKTIILQVKKNINVISNFYSLFPSLPRTSLVEVKAKKDNFEIYGIISRNTDSKNNLQFVYINNRLVLKTSIHKRINFLLAKSFFLKGIYHEKERNYADLTLKTLQDPPAYKKCSKLRTAFYSPPPPPQKDKHAVFLFNISCPRNEYTAYFYPKMTFVDFLNWEDLFSCLQLSVQQFLSFEENLKNMSCPESNFKSAKTVKCHKNFEKGESVMRDEKETLSFFEKCSVLEAEKNVTGKASRKKTKEEGFFQENLRNCTMTSKKQTEKVSVEIFESEKESLRSVDFEGVSSPNVKKHCKEQTVPEREQQKKVGKSVLYRNVENHFKKQTKKTPAITFVSEQEPLKGVDFNKEFPMNTENKNEKQAEKMLAKTLAKEQKLLKKQDFNNVSYRNDQNHHYKNDKYVPKTFAENKLSVSFAKEQSKCEISPKSFTSRDKVRSNRQRRRTLKKSENQIKSKSFIFHSNIKALNERNVGVLCSNKGNLGTVILPESDTSLKSGVFCIPVKDSNLGKNVEGICRESIDKSVEKLDEKEYQTNTVSESNPKKRSSESVLTNLSMKTAAPVCVKKAKSSKNQFDKKISVNGRNHNEKILKDSAQNTTFKIVKKSRVVPNVSIFKMNESQDRILSVVKEKDLLRGKRKFTARTCIGKVSSESFKKIKTNLLSIIYPPFKIKENEATLESPPKTFSRHHPNNYESILTDLTRKLSPEICDGKLKIADSNPPLRDVFDKKSTENFTQKENFEDHGTNLRCERKNEIQTLKGAESAKFKVPILSTDSKENTRASNCCLLISNDTSIFKFPAVKKSKFHSRYPIENVLTDLNSCVNSKIKNCEFVPKKNGELNSSNKNKLEPVTRTIRKSISSRKFMCPDSVRKLRKQKLAQKKEMKKFFPNFKNEVFDQNLCKPYKKTFRKEPLAKLFPNKVNIEQLPKTELDQNSPNNYKSASRQGTNLIFSENKTNDDKISDSAVCLRKSKASFLDFEGSQESRIPSFEASNNEFYPRKNSVVDNKSRNLRHSVISDRLSHKNFLIKVDGSFKDCKEGSNAGNLKPVISRVPEPFVKDSPSVKQRRIEVPPLFSTKQGKQRKSNADDHLEALNRKNCKNDLGPKFQGAASEEKVKINDLISHKAVINEEASLKYFPLMKVNKNLEERKSLGTDLVTADPDDPNVNQMAADSSTSSKRSNQQLEQSFISNSQYVYSSLSNCLNSVTSKNEASENVPNRQEYINNFKPSHENVSTFITQNIIPNDCENKNVCSLFSKRNVISKKVKNENEFVFHNCTDVFKNQRKEKNIMRQETNTNTCSTDAFTESEIYFPTPPLMNNFLENVSLFSTIKSHNREHCLNQSKDIRLSSFEESENELCENFNKSSSSLEKLNITAISLCNESFRINNNRQNNLNLERNCSFTTVNLICNLTSAVTSSCNDNEKTLTNSVKMHDSNSSIFESSKDTFVKTKKNIKEDISNKEIFIPKLEWYHLLDELHSLSVKTPTKEVKQSKESHVEKISSAKKCFDTFLGSNFNPPRDADKNQNHFYSDAINTCSNDKFDLKKRNEKEFNKNDGDSVKCLIDETNNSFKSSSQISMHDSFSKNLFERGNAMKSCCFEENKFSHEAVPEKVEGDSSPVKIQSSENLVLKEYSGDFLYHEPHDLKDNCLLSSDNKIVNTQIVNREVQPISDEWIKVQSTYGDFIFVNSVSGMSYFSAPSKDVSKALDFKIQARHCFLPKGMSPIQMNYCGSEIDDFKELRENEKLEIEKTLLQYNLSSFKSNITLKTDSEYCSTKSFWSRCSSHSKMLKEFLRKPSNFFSQSFVFDKSLFTSLEVIGQLDKKFIVTVIQTKTGQRLVVLFDQHAIDERIRVEKLQKDYCLDPKTKTWKTTNINPPIELIVSEEFAAVLEEYSSKVKLSGLSVLVNGTVLKIFGVPSCLCNSVLKEPDLLRSAVSELLSEILHSLLNMNGALPAMPNCFQAAINEEACRRAIKFGDKLTLSQCETLIKGLESCQFPFQCAHGRPLLAPIIDLNEQF